MRFKGAIFDMDGVLFDTERVYQETWHEIAAEQGITLDGSFLRAITGTSGAHMCRVVEEYYHVPDATDIIRKCMEQVKQKLSVHVPMKKGVCEILDYFRDNGISMAVASSSATQQIEANLQLTGIRDYFSIIASGTEVRKGKPAPDIFLLAAERLECDPKECFVFEDSENGIKAGFAAGCFTVMVPDLIAATSKILPYCGKVCLDLSQAVQEIEKM